MRPDQFQPDAPGRLLRIGLPHAEHAFIPAPLPPKWKWPVELWRTLMEARVALAKLDGIGEHLPSPELLLTPLQRREAQRSSSLEGTIARPEDVLLFEADPRFPQSESDPANAWREVFNYGRALRIRQELGELPLSLRLIRELHRVLMDGVRGSNRTPGEFRQTQVHVGADVRYVPPPPQELTGCLDALEKYVHADQLEGPLVHAFMVHYQFEAIHPFTDGNGRVGRLLLSLMIAEMCGLSKPWLYMSAFFEDRKTEYMDRLLRVSTHNDWTSWIRFCLEGTIVQALDTYNRCRRLLEIRDRYHDAVRRLGGNVRLTAIIDDLFVRPVVRIPDIAKVHDVTYPTAKADVDKLAAAGILVEMHDRRPKLFYAKDVFDATYF